jgi:hypothetical protein
LREASASAMSALLRSHRLTFRLNLLLWH